MDEVTNAFLKWTKDNKDFEESVHVVKSNSQGRLWMIGGFVYKTIISELYGNKKPELSLRFFVEKPNENIKSYGWWVYNKQDKNGNYLFSSTEKLMMFTPLDRIRPMREMGIEPTINNYFFGIPLTVQAIVYDVNNSKIIGERGINSIMKKTVGINSRKFAERAARKLNIGLEEYVQNKADELGFRVEGFYGR